MWCSGTVHFTLQLMINHFSSCDFEKNTLEWKTLIQGLQFLMNSFKIVLMTSHEKNLNWSQTKISETSTSRNEKLKNYLKYYKCWACYELFLELEICQCIKRRRVLENHRICVQIAIRHFLWQEIKKKHVAFHNGDNPFSALFVANHFQQPIA